MGFADKLKALFGFGLAKETIFEDLCDLLIEGDMGANLAYKASEELRALCAKERISGEREIRLALKRVLSPFARSAPLDIPLDDLSCILVLGVNGVGKTTTIAKLAAYYKARGMGTGIILAAADTFRAAAIDQLKIHGERLSLRVVAQSQGSDPGAVIYDAIDAAISSQAHMIIADTAGRMHTKQNLVRELEKLNKIVGARIAPNRYHKILVLDATTGQNALAQALAFNDAVSVDAIIVTKHDSSAKGGIVLAIAHALDLPTAFIGFGEKLEDLKPFDGSLFLDEFLALESNP